MKPIQPNHSPKKLIEVKLDGRPTIWVEPTECERCKPFGTCLQLTTLTDAEWEGLQDGLHNATDQRAFLEAAVQTLKATSKRNTCNKPG